MLGLAGPEEGRKGGREEEEESRLSKNDNRKRQMLNCSFSASACVLLCVCVKN